MLSTFGHLSFFHCPWCGPNMELFSFFHYSITMAAVSMTAVAISSGAVLGKTNPLQLIVMTVVEIIIFHVSRWINKRFLQVQ